MCHMSFPDPDQTIDPNGCSEESSISVLLTWSRNLKCDNSVIKNGRKKIRAPIWNPEFPIKEQNSNKRGQQPNSYSLGQLFVADTCEEAPNKRMRLENLSLIDDRYVCNFATQRQDSRPIYIEPTGKECGHSGTVYRPASYLQPSPEVSTQSERVYQYYDANAIQSMPMHASDVPWYPYRHSPQTVDADLIPNNRATILEGIDHDPRLREERYYSVDYRGDEYPQVLYPPHQFYQTCKIQGRDITAL